MAGVECWRRSLGAAPGAAAEPVTEFGLDNGLLRLAVWSYGATVVEVSARERPAARERSAARERPAGERPTAPATNLVLRLPDLAAYQASADRAYVGSTLGRFARLVAGGQARIAGRRHQLTRNAGAHHIHGGHRGFDAQVWSGAAAGGAATGHIDLDLVSPDGDQGYPGTLSCTARFELDTEDRITIRYQASTDQPTLVGLTNHSFWNLAGQGSIDSHVLQVAAEETVEADEQFVPTGRLIPVAGGQRDFRQPRRLGASVLDDCFALTSGTPAARLRHPGTGWSLELATDQPGLAVYTGDGLPTPRAGLCLQPGPWPDAPNQPSFPPAELLPGQLYHHTSTFSLSWKEPTAGDWTS